MTSVIKILKEKFNYQIYVFSSYPEIFYNNPRVEKVFGVKDFSGLISRFLNSIEGGNVRRFYFNSKSNISFEEYMRESKTKAHLAYIHSNHFLESTKSTNFINEIFLTKKEIKKYEKKFNLPKDYVIINPESKLTYTVNKQWPIERFNQVIHLDKDNVWIQVGNASDFLLDNVIDLRGKTSLRELFFLVSKAKFILSNEGLLNHVASAFNVTSYVIQSGFSYSDLSYYPESVHIFNNSCNLMPCWFKNDCCIKDKPCLDRITPKDVLKFIK